MILKYISRSSLEPSVASHIWKFSTLLSLCNINYVHSMDNFERIIAAIELEDEILCEAKRHIISDADILFMMSDVFIWFYRH